MVGGSRKVEIKVNNNTGLALKSGYSNTKDSDSFTSDWVIFGYSGKAAYSSDYDEFVSFVSTKETANLGIHGKMHI